MVTRVGESNGLLAAIREYQAKHGMSDPAFARRLGIHKSTWCRVKQGQRNPGAKVLRAIAREFPELQLLVFQYMAQGEEKVEAASE